MSVKLSALTATYKVDVASNHRFSYSTKQEIVEIVGCEPTSNIVSRFADIIVREELLRDGMIHSSFAGGRGFAGGNTGGKPAWQVNSALVFARTACSLGYTKTAIGGEGHINLTGTVHDRGSLREFSSTILQMKGSFVSLRIVVIVNSAVKI